MTGGLRDRLEAARRGLADHAAVVTRIARWEATRSAGVLDRRTVALGALALVLAGAVGAAAVGGGAALDRGIYRVGVDADSPYRAPVEETAELVAAPPDPEALKRGDLDVLVVHGRVATTDTHKGRAALAAFRSAVQDHNDRSMATEENVTAAFPVVVNLEYVQREAVLVGEGGAETADDGRDAGGGGGTGGDGGSGAAPDRSDADSGDDPLAVPGIGGGGGVLATSTTGSPADISPPFPFASLVLAFAFLVPMNFVSQTYGSTILGERINRRGELLLVAPVTPGDIVAGKTLPYLLGTLLVTVVIAAAVGGSTVSVAAVFPIALLFLAATFLGAMLARSYKELTFISVAISVFLTSYAFVPAIFTSITPIALISPLTLVVRDLQGTGVALGEYAFSTGPFYVSAGVLFLLGRGIYREEDMFTQRPVPLKFLDALDSQISGPRSMVALGALAIPFVFIAELLAVAVLFALPIDLSVPVLLVGVAAVEELAKSLPVYAAFANGRFSRTPRTAAVLGALAGFGFFLGEKFTAVVQVVGLPQLPLGEAAFGTAGIGVPSAAALLVAPLVLHVVATGVASFGAARGRGAYGWGLIAAIATHAVYNLAVVNTLG